jgi:hypothetical protein
MSVYLDISRKEPKMDGKATVTIVLEYDLDNLADTLAIEDTLSDEEIYDMIEDYTYEDLIDLMRGDRLRYWSEVVIERKQ